MGLCGKELKLLSANSLILEESKFFVCKRVNASANSLNLGKSKILSFGKMLKINLYSVSQFQFKFRIRMGAIISMNAELGETLSLSIY